MICETCGNPIETDCSTCPFCESPVSAPLNEPGKSSRLTETINIKQGMPTVSEALQILAGIIDERRQSHGLIVKLIHGYGSTGTGGRIREAVRRRLQLMRARGDVRFVIPGEEFARGHQETDLAMGSFPRLRDDTDFQRQNAGITIVVF